MASKEYKANVRKSKEWKELRSRKQAEQKLDPVTKKPIRKGANLHHLDWENYGDLTDEKFVLLNRNTHDIIHFFAGNDRLGFNRNWRDRVAAVVAILEKMEQYLGV